MAFIKQLPKTCQIETNIFFFWTARQASYICGWLRFVNTSHSLRIFSWYPGLDKEMLQFFTWNSTSKHFFTERRHEENYMWVRKTKNKRESGIATEIFRIDNKGRKCSILIPEGPDKFRWKTFLAMISFKHNNSAKDSFWNQKRHDCTLLFLIWYRYFKEVLCKGTLW